LGLKHLERSLVQSEGTEAAMEQVRKLQALTSEIGQDLHRTAADLRPTALDDLGLVRALEALASDWADRFGILVDVHMNGSDLRLSQEVETAIYRIVQEALTNVMKHSQAKNVSIVVDHKPTRLRLVVEDDGIGFDPDAAIAPDGENDSGPFRPRLGLSGIRERLALINGSLAVESTPGAGTTLFIQVPLSPAEGRLLHG
jgi:signal transduction histidine kinase